MSQAEQPQNLPTEGGPPTLPFTPGIEQPRLSIVIPCFNEASLLEETARALAAYLDHEPWDPVGVQTWEIVFVNDGSTDHSAEVLARLAAADPRIRSISYRKNGGQGKALRLGFLAARGEWVFCVDADLDYAPAHIGQFLGTALTEGADVVVGSPFRQGGAMVGVPWVRRLMSRAMNWYFGHVLRLDLTAYTAIVRLYRRAIIDKLLLVSDDKDILPEILIKAKLLHLSIVEVPATLHWRRKTVERRGKGSGITTTTRKALRHLLWGVIENPLLFFLVPSLVAGCATVRFGFAVLWLVARAYHATEGGFLVDLTKACNYVISTAPQTCAFFALCFQTLLIVSTIGLVVFQNKTRKEHEYIYFSRLMENLRALRGFNGHVCVAPGSKEALG